MSFVRTIRRTAAVAAVVAALAGAAGTALAVDPVFSTYLGGAIRGYDPVAYFTEERPVKGKRAHRAEWMGATWSFASEENRKLFESDPEKYAPRYGGYCAWGLPPGRVVSRASRTGFRLSRTRRASSTSPRNASSVYSCMRRSLRVWSR